VAEASTAAVAGDRRRLPVAATSPLPDVDSCPPRLSTYALLRVCDWCRASRLYQPILCLHMSVMEWKEY